jgi:peptide/nickel transport system permease protein
MIVLPQSMKQRRRGGILPGQLRVASRNSQGVVWGGLLLLVATGSALLSFIWTPYAANTFSVAAAFGHPSLSHLAGTDEYGRDIFSRIMVGGRASLGISCSAVVIALAVGLVLGPLTGYVGGALDVFLTRVVDVVMAIPALVLALGIVAVLGPSGSSVTIALAFAYAPTFARVFRSVVVATRDQPYVQASRGLAVPTVKILLKDILPNVLPIVAVQATTSLAWGIMDEASLGFLGLGVQPPSPSWGSLLIEGRQFMFEAPWLPIGAGIAVVLAVLGINLLGDALRDVLDPRDWSRI